VQTARRPTDSGLQRSADFSSNLIIYVTKQGSLKCLAHKAEVNQAKHCALGKQSVRTELAVRSVLGVIKCSLLVTICDGIIVMLDIPELHVIQNTRLSYAMYRLLLPRCSVATADEVMCKYCFGSTRWRSWWRHCATSRKVAGSIH
jgi:hypothetical protein